MGRGDLALKTSSSMMSNAIMSVPSKTAWTRRITNMCIPRTAMKVTGMITNVPKFEIEDMEWGCGFMTRFVGKERPEIETRTEARTNKDGSFQAETEAGTWTYGPAQMVTKIHMTAENWMHQYIYEAPLDDGNIRVFLVNMRNCLMDPAMDQPVVDRCMAIAGQDITVLEKMDPVKTPRSITREVMMPADGPIVRYREYLQRWENNGWKIDVGTFKKERETNDIAFAIPSPGRRASKNWVLDPTPLVPGKRQQKAAAE